MAVPDQTLYKPGFPKEIITSGVVDPKFVCFVCDKLLRTPLQSFCGHRFCKACVQKLLSGKDSVLCPSCRSEASENEFSVLKLDQMFPDNAIKRDFNVVKVKCINAGCPWTGTLKIYEDHESNCEYQSVLCELCKQQIPIKSKAFHDTNECPERPWVCDYCRSTLPHKRLQDHRDVECEFVPVDCQYCGVKGIPRAQMRDHYETGCREDMTLCKIQRCNDVVRKEDLGKHNKDKAVDHISHVNQSVEQLEDKIKRYCDTNDMNINKIQQSITTLQQSPTQSGDAQQGAVGGAPSAPLTELPSGDVGRRLQVQDTKIDTFESIAAVLNSEILKCLNKIEDISRRIGENGNQTVLLTNQVKELELASRTKDEVIARLTMNVSQFTETAFDGIFVWKIEGVGRKRQDAIAGRVTSLYSPPFFSSRTGYKMCARLYFNGDGMGRGSHLSIYFVIMKGEYDALMRWPFRQKVTLMLLDQNRREHVIDAFRPDPSSSSFKQPTSDMNIASGCPLFCPLTTLDTVGNKAYIKSDTMFVKIIVDTSDLA